MSRQMPDLPFDPAFAAGGIRLLYRVARTYITSAGAFFRLEAETEK